MHDILNTILDRTMSRVREHSAGTLLNEIVDRATEGGRGEEKEGGEEEEERTSGSREGRGKRRKRKRRRKGRVPFCCDTSICSAPSSPVVGVAEEPEQPQWVLDERALALRVAEERRRVLLRLRRCVHWRSLHALCGCPRQRSNQWRSWDLHSHFCPEIGVRDYLQEEVRQDMQHLEELFHAHLQEMNEGQWPSAYDLLCKKAKPSPFAVGDAKAFYSASSSSSGEGDSSYFTSTSSFEFSERSSSSPSSSSTSARDDSAESVARGIVYDLLTGLREAASDQSSSDDHWGDKGDYDERNTLPWVDDPETMEIKDSKPRRLRLQDDEYDDDVVLVDFFPEDKLPSPEQREYYGPGPDGTRARPDPPSPGPPFDVHRGDEALLLEF